MNYKFLLGIICALFSFTVLAEKKADLETLRSHYQNWTNTYQSLSKSEQLNKLNDLKTYPLYPYAKYQYLQANIDTLTPNQMNQFVRDYPDFPFSSSLIQQYLEHLNKQKKWSEITKLSVDSSLTSYCYYHYALYQKGQKKKALQSVKKIWLSGHDLPSACDPLFEVWDKSGGKTANLTLLRIELMLQNNNIKLARYLTNQLPDNYKTIRKQLLDLYDNPKKLSAFSKAIYPTSFSKKVVLSSFNRLVNIDSEAAKKLLPTLVKQQKLNKKQENDLWQMLAISYFKSTATEQQQTWRDEFIIKNKEVSLIERRIRASLKENNMQQVAHWLSVLPKSAKQKDEWRYWQAMILISQNKQEEANKILMALTKERGFYAMYSAQKLAIPDTFNFQYSVISNTTAQAEIKILNELYDNQKVILRIKELRHWNQYTQANREWRSYLYSSKNKQYAKLARYAYLQGWGEYSVQATIAGKLWNNWLERFPIVYKTLYTNALKEKKISLSYALAISRQESALEATVTSPAGAKGLMQLMPGTAKDSAKKIKMVSYTSSEQLYDPKTNIELGTHYLDYVYNLFNENRILSSAAYNAGPSRLNKWLQETQGKLDAIAFVESIPFNETRNYVKTVLVYDYIYQLLLQQEPKGILTRQEQKQQY